MQTVKITVIVLFNDVVNFAPKFALNYLHFAFFADLNIKHILLHHKIYTCRPRSSTVVHRRPPSSTVVIGSHR